MGQAKKGKDWETPDKSIKIHKYRRWGSFAQTQIHKKTHKNTQNAAVWPSNLCETLTSPSEPGQDGEGHHPLLGGSWR